MYQLTIDAGGKETKEKVDPSCESSMPLLYDPTLGAAYEWKMTNVSFYFTYFIQWSQLHYNYLNSIFQNNDRHYTIPDIILTDGQIRKIKNVSNMAQSDGSFISLILVAVYGMDTLKISSAEGKASPNGKTHIALDSLKLKFVKGNLYHIFTHSCTIHHVSCFIFSHLFRCVC